MTPHTRYAACLAVLLTGCAGTPTASVSDLEAVERARFAALTKQDITSLSTMLADDLVYCHSNGRCDTKTSFLDGIRTGAQVYRHIDIEEMRPRVMGTAGVINGTVAVQVEDHGKPLQFRLRYTDVYKYEFGRWRLAAWQSTRIP